MLLWFWVPCADTWSIYLEHKFIASEEPHKNKTYTMHKVQLKDETPSVEKVYNEKHSTVRTSGT